MAIRRKDIILVVFSTLIAMLAAEGIARLFITPAPRFVTGFRLSASGYYTIDDAVGWVPRPNVQGTHNQAGSFESTFSTNSAGLRDDEASLSKSDGRTTIVALGDSFTWGFGVNDDEIYTEVMESLLSDVEVVNLGVTAYGLRQEIDYFDRMGSAVDPDIVVVALVMNDITDPIRIRSGETVQQWLARIGFQPADTVNDAAVQPEKQWSFSGLKSWLADNSAIYRAFTDVVNTNKVLVDLLVAIGVKGEPAGIEGLDSNLRPFLVDYPDTVEASLEQTKQELLELRNLVRGTGAEFLVAVVPALQSVDAKARANSIAYTRYYDQDFDLDKPYRLLQEFGESAGIEILAPVDSFRKAHSEGISPYLNNDMHFNEVGHRLFAQEIVRFMQDKHWLP